MNTNWLCGLVTAGLLGVSGCGVFLPSDGYFGQPCSSGGTCAEGMSCVDGTCELGGQIWFVDPAAQIDRDGASWPTAFAHPQDAVDAARSGDQIWVAQATYHLRVPGDAVLLSLKDGVSVYGGFTGGETDQDARDPAGNPATLDCDQVCLHVIEGASQVTLSGFILRNGQADGASQADKSGGGLHASGVGDLVIDHCRFVGNSAESGGALSITQQVGDIHLRDCFFAANTAGVGGAIHADGTLSGQLHAERVVLSGNQASAAGGGIHLNLDSTASLTNLVLFDNQGSNGGAIYVSESDLQLVNSSLSGNQAGWAGGALWVVNARVTLVNSILFNDQASVQAPEIHVEAGDPPAASYSLVAGGWPGDVIMTSNPLFVDGAAGDLHLSPSSPCIDAGTAEHPVVQPPGDDLDGRNRPQGGNWDMGAYEFQQ
jgi:predicted outer membrane repeat protein